MFLYFSILSFMCLSPVAHSALAFEPRLEICAPYRHAVRRLRRLALRGARRRRPEKKGGKPAHFVQQQPGSDLSQSLVAEASDCLDHVLEAMDRRHPFEDDDDLPEDLQAAVDWVCMQGGKISSWRRQRCNEIRRIAASLDEVNAELSARMCDSSRELATKVGPVHFAFIAASLDALEWPDTKLVFKLLHGFETIGPIEDSGVYAASRTWASADLSETLAGNAAWVSRMRDDYAKRARKTGVSDDDAALWDKSMDEVSKGYATGPFTREELDQRFGYGCWRCIPRFAIWQKGKLRAVDDARRSLHNAITRTDESLICDRADFPLRMARAFARGIRTDPDMRLGTDDMEAAYRRVPVRDMAWSCVAQLDPGSREVRFFVLPGHNFGLVSAVLNFNRVPEFMVHAARRLLACCTSHFYDDYPVCEPSFSCQSSQGALGLLHDLAGFSFSEEKHEACSRVSQYLGVENDFRTTASDGIARVRMTSSRRRNLLGSIQEIVEARELTPHAASVLHGKMQFALTGAFGKVGRAALALIRERMWRHSGSFVLSNVLTSSLVFLWTLVRDAPDFSFSVRPSLEPAVLVYSDAMYDMATGKAQIGFAVWSPFKTRGGHSGWVHSYMDVSNLVQVLFTPRTQYITQLEVLAALVVYMSVPSWLAGRRVLHFIDNQGALSNLISCSSKDLDCAWMVHDFAIRAARLSCGVWFDYVRSKANLADLPSRGEFALLLAMGSVEVLTSVPQRRDWTSITGPQQSARPSTWIDTEGVLRAAFPTTTDPSPAT